MIQAKMAVKKILMKCSLYIQGREILKEGSGANSNAV
jgi:hypothetical protein